MKHPPEREADFQAVVVDYARLRGWMTYHTHDSRRSAAGFPDLVMVRDGQLVFAELKSEKGKTTPEQDAWLMALDAVMVGAVQRHHDNVECDCTYPVRSFIWRPSDWSSIEKELK